MNLSQALKQKSRLAGELVRQQSILNRENARRNDNKSVINREEVWNKIISISDDLSVLKGKIATANVGIYSKLEKMSELKSRIAFLTSLPTRSGEEIMLVGHNSEKLTYTWDSFINQSKQDELVADLQNQINALQDEVDAFNATTQI